MNNNNKSRLIGLITVLSYFIYTFFQAIPLMIVGIDYNKLSLNSKIAYLLIYELIFIIILFFINKDTFIHDFKDFAKNFKVYIKKYIDYWAMAFGLMLISNIFIVNILPDAVATNQENINSILGVAPLYMIISAVVFAPFVEETVFRLGIRKVIKNDILFVILSGLIFGGLHVVTSFENLIDLVYIIPYSIPGLVFAYTLVKSKNIFVPMSLHFFHNGFSMAIQLIAILLGALLWKNL